MELASLPDGQWQAYRDAMGERWRSWSHAERFSPVWRMRQEKRHGDWLPQRRLRWDEVIALPLPGSVAAEPPRSKRLRLATEVLTAELRDGARPAVEVFAAAERAGVSRKTTKRAKAVLGVRSSRRGFGPGSVVYWEPPPPAWTWVDADVYLKRLRDEARLRGAP